MLLNPFSLWAFKGCFPATRNCKKKYFRFINRYLSSTVQQQKVYQSLLNRIFRHQIFLEILQPFGAGSGAVITASVHIVHKLGMVV